MYTCKDYYILIFSLSLFIILSNLLNGVGLDEASERARRARRGQLEKHSHLHLKQAPLLCNRPHSDHTRPAALECLYV